MKSPGDWKIRRLEEVAKTFAGGTPSRGNPAYWGGSIPWVKTGEVNYRVIRQTEECITEEGLKNSSAKVAAAGTLLMALYGQGITRGKVAVLGIDSAMNQACLAIQPLNGEASSQYLYHYFSHNYLNLRKLGSETSQKNLSATVLSAIEIPLPPPSEQSKIAEILSCWDEGLKRVELLLKKSQLHRSLLAQQLITHIPTENLALATVSQIIMGQSPPSSAYNDNLDGLPLIQGNADLNGHRLRPKVWSSVASKIGLPGDILLTVRAPVGAVALVDRRICIGRGVAALRPNNIDNEYLFYILEASEHKWRRLEQGSTFTAVGSKEVLDFTIPVPTRREDQVLVGKTLKVLHQRVLTLENLRQNLGEQKQALMQKLLTGKIRVKV